MAHRLAHPAHQPVASLADGDAQQSGRDQRHSGRRSRPVVEHHALTQGPDRGRLRRPRHVGQVFLLDAERRMGEPVGEIAVVGEDQQTLGHQVEATDRKDARLGGNEAGDGRPSLRVVRGGDHPGGLVEEVVNEIGPHAHDHAVDLDHCQGRIHARPQPGHRAVDPHPPVRDQLLAGAAAAETAAGQNLLQALTFIRGHWSRPAGPSRSGCRATPMSTSAAQITGRGRPVRLDPVRRCRVPLASGAPWPRPHRGWERTRRAGATRRAS